jgi:pimeloyl-[acyl-carrier protein] methyl ester esterase
MLDEGSCYITLGNGDPLVLIHGWGVSSAIWSTVIKQLSQRYCVYLVDLPGFGLQPEPDDYALKTIAETLLKKLPEQAVWCGWSLGGLVATYVACHFPHRVKKLVQVSTSLKFVEEGDWLGVKKEVFELFKVNVIKQPQKTLNRFLSLQAMGSETLKSDIATIKQLMIDQPEPKLSALIAGLDLLSTVDLRKEFAELKMPCLHLIGALDTLVPIANAEVLIKLNPLQQHVTLKNSSHAPFISEPEPFIEALINFINH